MANRANAGLAWKAQTGLGAPATTGLKAIPFVTFGQGLGLARVERRSVTASRLRRAGRAGPFTLAPTATCEHAPLDYDGWLASLFLGAWSTDTLVLGNTRTYLTLEDRQSDAGYVIYEDVLANSLTLNLQPGGLVGADWALVALNIATSATPTASLVAADGADPFDSWTGSLTYNSGALDVTSLRLTVGASHEPRQAILQGRQPNRIVTDLDSVTGQMTVEYSSLTILEDALGDSTKALAFTMVNGTRSQTWTLAGIKITSFDAPVADDPERIATAEFEADVVGGNKLQVVRDNT